MSASFSTSDRDQTPAIWLRWTRALIPVDVWFVNRAANSSPLAGVLALAKRRLDSQPLAESTNHSRKATNTCA